MIKYDGKEKHYESGNKRSNKEGRIRYSLIPIWLLKRLANWLTGGAGVYGAWNWKNANSKEEYLDSIDSLQRHLYDYLNGEEEEDNMAAIIFNLMQAERVKMKLKEKGERDPSIYEGALVSKPKENEGDEFKGSRNIDYTTIPNSEVAKFIGDDGKSTSYSNE